MATEIITKDDLEEFRIKLIEELKALLNINTEAPAKWLKSYQVLNILKISKGTLQTLRMNKTINCTKIGGIFYYSDGDIRKLLEGKTVNPCKKIDC